MNEDDDVKVVLNTVPAKIEGQVVGKAIIYEDGSFDMVLDENLTDEMRVKIKEKTGYDAQNISGRLGDMNRRTDGSS